MDKRNKQITNNTKEKIIINYLKLFAKMKAGIGKMTKTNKHE